MSTRDEIVFDPPPLGTVLSLTGLPGSGATARDMSPYGNHGAIIGATWKKLPSGLWCLFFDGTEDYVTVTTSASLNILNAITVKMWLRERTQGINDTLLRKNIKYILYENPADEMRWYIDTADGAFFVNFPALSTATWYHVVATYDKDAGANNLKLYINTSVVSDTATGAIDDTAADDLFIGSQDAVPAGLFDGDIALVEIYKDVAWSALGVINSFHREKHLFGV